MKRRTSHRPERVAEAIRQTVAAFLTGSVRDPRVGFVTVTAVEVSADLTHARVRVSVMGSDEDKAKSLEGLTSARSEERRVGKEGRWGGGGGEDKGKAMEERRVSEVVQNRGKEWR